MRNQLKEESFGDGIPAKPPISPCRLYRHRRTVAAKVRIGHNAIIVELVLLLRSTRRALEHNPAAIAAVGF